MSHTRPSLKQLSFALTLLILKVFNEPMVVGTHDLPQLTTEDTDHNVDLDQLSLHNPEGFINTIAEAQPDELITVGEAKLSLIITDIARREEYNQLYELLQAAETPENELYRFNTLLNFLRQKEQVLNPESYLPLLQLCHLIEDFKPSTLIGRLIQQTAAAQFNETLPTLKSLLLDYHVMKMDYKSAEKYLDANLSETYLATFNRVAKRAELIDSKPKPSLFELFQHNQVKTPKLPYTNAKLSESIGDIAHDYALMKVEFSLLSRPEQDELKSRPTFKTFSILKVTDTDKYTQEDVDILKQALLEIDNPYLKHLRKQIITALLARNTENSVAAASERETVRSALHVVTSIASTHPDPEAHKFPNVYKTLSTALLKNHLNFNHAEATLSIRSALAHSEELSHAELTSALAKYKQYLNFDHSNAAPLFLTHDILDENLIHRLYPAETAKEIIEREKSLSKYPSPVSYLTPPEEHTKTMTTNAQVVALATSAFVIYFIYRCATIFRLLFLPRHVKVHPKKGRPIASDVKKETRKTAAAKASRIKPVIAPAPVTPKEIKQPSIAAPVVTQVEAPTEKKPMIKPTPLTLREKINKLINNDRFPPQKWVAWVRLPTTTPDDAQDMIGIHTNDAAIKVQVKKLVDLYDPLIQSNDTLKTKQAQYINLVETHDNTPNATDDTLLKIQTQLHEIQQAADLIIDEIESKSKTYEDTLASITKRIKELESKAKRPQETEEERRARLANVRAAKLATKAAKAEQAAEAARIAEAQARLAAERVALNEERLREALLNRTMEASPEIKMHFRYAHNALLVLNDIARASAEDANYLRDACLLNCSQLYEALSNLSQTDFRAILPETAGLDEHRNTFVHHAVYADHIDWRNIAAQTYEAFFTLIDAYYRVNPNVIIPEVKIIPRIEAAIPNSDTVSRDDKIEVFLKLCTRYSTFCGTLKKIAAKHEKQETPIQHEEINLLVLAMRGLILQIVEVGNAIGISRKSKHMLELLSYRNQEAHNGDRTDRQTLINLGAAIKELSSTIKPSLPSARPSQRGLYARPTQPSPHPDPNPRPSPRQ